MKKLKKHKTLIALIMSVVLTIAVTYSWFATFYAVQNIAGEFFYELDITITESTTNIVRLDKALPMEATDAVRLVSPHQFVVDTTGNAAIDYYVIIKDITSDEVLSITPTNVYFAINVDESAYYSVGNLEPNPSKRHLIYIGKLPANGTHTISLRIWLGPGAIVEGAASYTDYPGGTRTYRYFDAQVVVEAD